VISAIALAALSGRLHVVRTDKGAGSRATRGAHVKGRVGRQAHLQQAEADFERSHSMRMSHELFARVAASLRSAGRKLAARAYDALIAPTALANDQRCTHATPTTSQRSTG